MRATGKRPALAVATLWIYVGRALRHLLVNGAGDVSYRIATAGAQLRQ